jgi:hypothetical protein
MIKFHKEGDEKRLDFKLSFVSREGSLESTITNLGDKVINFDLGVCVSNCNFRYVERGIKNVDICIENIEKERIHLPEDEREADKYEKLGIDVPRPKKTVGLFMFALVITYEEMDQYGYPVGTNEKVLTYCERGLQYFEDFDKKDFAENEKVAKGIELFLNDEGIKCEIIRNTRDYPGITAKV